MANPQARKKSFLSIRAQIWVSAVLVVMILSAYGQVRNHSFIIFDDGLYVTENNHVKTGLSPGNVKWALTATYATNWHPLTWISHMLDVQLFGLNAGGHHLTNVLFHILNTLLLFLVFQRATKDLWPSAFVAALFALHPLHVESVAWVAERKDVLSTFFWMLTLLSYIWYTESRSGRRYLTVFVCFVAGLMSKPMVVTLPFVLLLLDFWPLKRAGSTPCRGSETLPFHSLFKEKIPFLILSAASCIVTFLAQQSGGAVRSLESYSLGTRLANPRLLWAT